MAVKGVERAVQLAHQEIGVLAKKRDGGRVDPAEAQTRLQCRWPHDDPRIFRLLCGGQIDEVNLREAVATLGR
jgi:hypothetical protein